MAWLPWTGTVLEEMISDCDLALNRTLKDHEGQSLTELIKKRLDSTSVISYSIDGLKKYSTISMPVNVMLQTQLRSRNGKLEANQPKTWRWTGRFICNTKIRVFEDQIFTTDSGKS